MNRQIPEKKILDLARQIGEKFHPDKIILFGSWAWGNPGPDSDVDLFIIKQTDNTRRLGREMDGALFPRPFPLDLIVYQPEEVEKRLKGGDFFIHEIMTRGKILYDGQANPRTY